MDTSEIQPTEEQVISIKRLKVELAGLKLMWLVCKCDPEVNCPKIDGDVSNPSISIDGDGERITLTFSEIKDLFLNLSTDKTARRNLQDRLTKVSNECLRVSCLRESKVNQSWFLLSNCLFRVSILISVKEIKEITKKAEGSV